MSIVSPKPPHPYLLRRIEEEEQSPLCREGRGGEVREGVPSLLADFINRLLDGKSSISKTSEERGEIRGDAEEEEEEEERRRDNKERKKEEEVEKDVDRQITGSEVLCLLRCMWRLRGTCLFLFSSFLFQVRG